MPLKACNPTHKYQVLFATVGPYGSKSDKQLIQTQVQTMIRQHVGDSRIVNMVTTAEQGESGYRHLHIGLELREPMRWSAMNKKLRMIATEWLVDEDETRKLSSRWFYVPSGSKGKKGFDIISDYVKNPVKDKEVGEYIDFDQRQKWWIVDGKVVDWQAAICELVGKDYKPTFMSEKFLRWEQLSPEERQRQLETSNCDWVARVRRNHNMPVHV